MRSVSIWLALELTLSAAAAAQDWPAYGGDAGGRRYSALDRIRPDNVRKLTLAWSFRTGELGQNARDGADLTFEATPVHFRGRLYLTTAFGVIFALDPTTGEEIWKHDPRVPRDRSYAEVTSRGVAVWEDGGSSAPAEGSCRSRILYGTIDARLIALDAETGRPCADFGRSGEVSLAAAVRMEGNGDYQVTSAPAVVDDVVVVGASIGDNWSVDTGSGVVRGFHARTGELLWSWDPIERVEGRVGGANAWSTPVTDPTRDLVFVPTSSPSPDFFGGFRPGDSRWASSVVALRASKGELVWGFQSVHHDLWDYDLAAPPLLASVEREGTSRAVVVQATKTGFVFVLDRETGAPVFSVEERRVPASDVPGESTSPTQPFPAVVPPLIDSGAADPMRPWALTEEDRAACREAAEGVRWEGPFTPPSTRGTLMYPGNGAGTNWGGGAFDPERGLLFLPTNQFATLVRLIPREELERAGASARRLGEGSELGRQRGAPFGMERVTWLAPSGLPCTPPPWGTLHAIDLNRGTLAWSVPIGTMPGTEIAGAPSPAGPLATAGGLVFLGSYDGFLRAYDSSTGEVLFRTELPRAPIASPMTYMGRDGAQYVVVAAGGHGKMGLPVGDSVVAFKLPRSR